MDFNSLQKPALIRIGLLLFTMLLFCYLLVTDSFFVTELVLFVLLGLQVIGLLKSLPDPQQHELSDLFLAELR